MLLTVRRTTPALAQQFVPKLGGATGRGGCSIMMVQATCEYTKRLCDFIVVNMRCYSIVLDVYEKSVSSGHTRLMDNEEICNFVNIIVDNILL